MKEKYSVQYRIYRLFVIGLILIPSFVLLLSACGVTSDDKGVYLNGKLIITHTPVPGSEFAQNSTAGSNSQDGTSANSQGAGANTGIIIDLPGTGTENNVKPGESNVDFSVRKDVRGIYIAGNLLSSSARVDDLYRLLDNCPSINAVVVDVKLDDGRLLFPIEAEYVKKYYTGSYVMPDIAEFNEFMAQMKKRNIYVIGRIVSFVDNVVAGAHPEIAMTFADGTLYKDSSKKNWLNPYNTESWMYILSVAEEASKAGFDEINFDYVRFSTESGNERVVYGGLSEIPEYTREVIIETFLDNAVRKIHNNGVYVSADCFGIVINGSIDEKNLGQNYVNLAKIVDYLCPMIYPSHYASGYLGIAVPDARPYEIISGVLAKSNARLEEVQGATIRPWLQAFTASWVSGYIEYDANAIKQQIQATYDSELGGWLLWNSQGLYEDDIFK